MRASPAVEPTTRSNTRSLKKLQINGPLAMTRVRARGRGYYIELPHTSWDKIVLFMFICSLFIFLHAFFGFGVEEELRAEGSPHTLWSSSISPLWCQSPLPPDQDRKTRPQGTSRVMVDWHGNYELLPSTTSPLVAPASTPQNAFPDPTPAQLIGTEHGRVLGQESLFMTAEVKTSDQVLFPFYENPHDPFRLEFEGTEGDGRYELYPVAGPPRATPQDARVRRSGRCLVGGRTCL